MRYFLGIDFGGGASKATLLCENGEVRAASTTEYPTYYPQAGYAEQNPADWVRAVIMDENFNVIRPSIYWTDTRSTAEVAFLKQNYSDIIEKQVLHKADTIWSLPELMWIKNNEPDNWARVRKIMFAKDYVRHRLTGDYVTDYIEAEGSMMFDINTMRWSGELCSVLGIEPSMLPEIVKPTDIVGKITKSAADMTGLSEGTPVLCGTTDTVMEVFAAGATEKGQMTLKLATAGRICVVTDRAYPDTNLINYSHITDGLFYPGTATKSCAASYRWFRDTFGGDFKELDKMAESVDIGCEGLVFHPYLNGELTPYANPKLCADFVGVRSSHTMAHFARAVLEGVVMSMLDCKEALEKLNIPHGDCAAIIGGGAKSNLWRQMISDCLGLRLTQMKYADSSFGSAMLAGIAAGAFESPKKALEICNKKVSETVPNPENTKKYREVFKKYKAVQKALEPIYNGEY